MPFIKPTSRHTFDYDVGCGNQAAKCAHSFARFGVKCYAVLVRVQREEDAALLRVRHAAGEGPHLSRDIALRRLHLDDLGTEARENLAAIGRGHTVS